MKDYLYILLLLLWNVSNAQDEADTKALFNYSLGLHQAFVLVHSESVRPVENSYPRGIQGDVSWQQRSEEAWNMCRCFPKVGASLQLWDFDTEVLGYGANAYFYIEPEYGSSKFFSFSFRGGFGASFLSNPHDSIENFNNQSYSTHLAFSLVLALKAGFRISEKTRLDISPYYNHVSNGGTKKPNAGINYPSIYIGITHYPQSPEFRNYAPTKWKKEDRLKRLDLTPFIAQEQVKQGVRVFSPGMEIKGSRQFARINALTLGLEYLEDNFAKYRFEQDSIVGQWRTFSTAIGHEFLLNRLIFSQQIGLYLYNPDWDGTSWYHRWGLIYYPHEKFALGVNMKAHKHVAYLIDFRVTYSL